LKSVAKNDAGSGGRSGNLILAVSRNYHIEAKLAISKNLQIETKMEQLQQLRV
jgi:hypothetical protein